VLVARQEARRAVDELYAVAHELVARDVRLGVLHLLHALQNVLHAEALAGSGLAVVEGLVAVARQVQRRLAERLRHKMHK
jgi:hypothetical protein